MNAKTPSLTQRLRSKNDAWNASAHGNRRVDSLRRRPVRRGLVAGSFLLLLSAVMLVWANVTGVWYLAVALLFVAAGWMLTVVMRAHWPDQALDERLVAVRNDAYRTSYRILGVVTGLGIFAVSAAWQVQAANFDLEPHQLRAVLLAFVGLALMMPAAVLAWREREV